MQFLSYLEFLGNLNRKMSNQRHRKQTKTKSTTNSLKSLLKKQEKKPNKQTIHISKQRLKL